MTNSFKTLIFLSLLIVTACDTDDETESLSGENRLTLEFDNSFSGDDLLLETSSYTNANGETLSIARFNYIVSNFMLIDENGEEFRYPKDESYFIISEENGLTEVILENIPAGNYIALRFGLGVDQEKYQQGAEGQGDFLEIAEENEMMWSWQAGYKFLNFEGSFTSESNSEQTDFKIHTGSHGSSLDNYKEVQVNFPSDAVVSADLSPLVHFEVDASSILTGTHKIKLSEKAVIMVDEEKSPKIAENALEMFSVHHIHNGTGGHH